jgi:hypothetical protein
MQRKPGELRGIKLCRTECRDLTILPLNSCNRAILCQSVTVTLPSWSQYERQIGMDLHGTNERRMCTLYSHLPPLGLTNPAMSNGSCQFRVTQRQSVRPRQCTSTSFGPTRSVPVWGPVYLERHPFELRRLMFVGIQYLYCFRKAVLRSASPLEKSAVRSGPGPVGMGKESDLPASLVFGKIYRHDKREEYGRCLCVGMDQEKADTDILRLFLPCHLRGDSES